MEKNRCTGCKYYRHLGNSNEMFCNYLLDNRRRRERDGDECLSYEPKRKKRVSSSPPKTARRKAAEPGGGVGIVRA